MSEGNLAWCFTLDAARSRHGPRRRSGVPSTASGEACFRNGDRQRQHFPAHAEVRQRLVLVFGVWQLLAGTPRHMPKSASELMMSSRCMVAPVSWTRSTPSSWSQLALLPSTLPRDLLFSSNWGPSPVYIRSIGSKAYIWPRI